MEYGLYQVFTKDLLPLSFLNISLDLVFNAKYVNTKTMNIAFLNSNPSLLCSNFFYLKLSYKIHFTNIFLLNCLAPIFPFTGELKNICSITLYAQIVSPSIFQQKKNMTEYQFRVCCRQNKRNGVYDNKLTNLE